MRRTLRGLLGLGVALVSVACGLPDRNDNSPWMRPGEDCISCHREGGEAADKQWTAAGTLFNTQGDAAEGAQVFIKDASGRSVTLTANGAGNFYTAEKLEAPFQTVSISADGKQWTHMPSVWPASASCNSCHTETGAAGSRLVVRAP